MLAGVRMLLIRIRYPILNGEFLLKTFLFQMYASVSSWLAESLLLKQGRILLEESVKNKSMVMFLVKLVEENYRWSHRSRCGNRESRKRSRCRC